MFVFIRLFVLEFARVPESRETVRHIAQEGWSVSAELLSSTGGNGPGACCRTTGFVCLLIKPLHALHVHASTV